MKTVACLIARTNSTRLPEKVLLPVGDRLLIEHIIDRLKMVPGIDRIYLCTSTEVEDQRLEAVAARNGIGFYAGSPVSPIDRMLAVGRQENADCLLRVTGDNVFTDPVYLTEMIARHQAAQVDYTRMMRVPIGLSAEVMSLPALERCYATLDPAQSEYLMLYMFQPERFRCQVVLPEPGFEGGEYSLTVDTPADLERTRFILQHVSAPWVTYPAILDLHRAQPIPHFVYPAQGTIKLPDRAEMPFTAFLEEMDARAERSTQVSLPKGHYASVIGHLNA